MGHYRKIDVRIWNDAKFSRLSNPAKLSFVFLLTHPGMTGLGCMRGTFAGFASELGWPVEGYPEGMRHAIPDAIRHGMTDGNSEALRTPTPFDELTAAKLVEYDEKAAFVCVPNFLRYNAPASVNAVKSWSKVVDLIPECDTQVEHFKRVVAYVEGMGDAFADAIPDAIRKSSGMPCCIQRTENREQRTENIRLSTGVDSLSEEAEFVRSWNQTPGVRTIRGDRLTDKRRRAFRARIKDPSWDWRRALGKFPLRCFDHADDWKPDADWFLKPDSVTAILEGRYDWTKAKTNGHSKAALRGREVQDDFAHLA